MKIAQLNNSEQEAWEDLEHFRLRTYYLVDNDYDFIGNSASNVTSIEYLNKFYTNNRLYIYDYRESVKSHYINEFSSDFDSLSSYDKNIISELFLEDYTERTTVHNYNDMKQNAKLLTENLVKNKNVPTIKKVANDIATASYALVESILNGNVNVDITSINGIHGENIILDTSDIEEGSNLYYTNSRARASISSSNNGITYSTTTGLISLNAYARDISYNSATPSNWLVNPIKVSNGLDELSFRLNQLESNDRKQVSANSSVTTSSSSFIDITDMRLTTLNTKPKNYLILFSASFDGSNGKECEIQITINGVAQTSTVRRFHTSGTGLLGASTTIYCGTQLYTGLLNNNININAQWRKVTNGGSVNIHERTLIIISL